MGSPLDSGNLDSDEASAPLIFSAPMVVRMPPFPSWCTVTREQALESI
jgi:hypothetical protein